MAFRPLPLTGVANNPAKGANVFDSVLKSLPNNAITQQPFDSVGSNDGGYVVGPTFVIPANMGGLYLIVAFVTFNNPPNAGYREAAIRLNGAPIIWDNSGVGPFGNMACAPTILRPLVPGDVVDVTAFQNSGLACNTFGAFRLFRVAA